MLPKTIRLLFLIFCVGHAFAQTPPARLIIRGDDMGFSHSGNLALVESYKKGIETSIEVIVPSPWFPEAVQLLKEIPDADVGIHLALTSEWDLVKWRPMTQASSLVDADGYFYPMVFPNKNYPGRAIAENKWKLEDIEREFRAQIETALRHIPRISHLSSHMGCTALSKEVTALTKKLAQEYKIDIDTDAYKVQRLPLEGPRGTPTEKAQSFMNALSRVEPGKTYLFVEHPGLDNAELRAIHHIGYENVAEDRQGVTDLFTSADVKAKIKAKGIRLISYKDLLESNK
ncbi:polysaccharide deacetylase family protein [Salmonirosea aquatica]|uniref:ChbG/HpnK family deacetylase n=1 Tax=Salmonirosea aquatica TaxID=2654236 RepID=A0A7C9BDX9_9BACT|nr:ChbG/HpnK family deacetylase [Cytophagaceae bacterium SJW1-29]